MTRRAFTLIELLVVAAIFSFTFLLGTAVFTNIQRSQRGILARQKVVADGRYMMETMARTVRLGYIDYAYSGYTDADGIAASGLNDVAVIDPLGQRICYRRNGQTMETASDATCSTWSSITPDDVVVEDFRAYVQPRSDPFQSLPSAAGGCRLPANYDAAAGVCTCDPAHLSGGQYTDCFTDQICALASADSTTTICRPPNAQPFVIVYLKTRSTASGAGEKATATLQTTVTTRSYKR